MEQHAGATLQRPKTPFGIRKKSLDSTKLSDAQEDSACVAEGQYILVLGSRTCTLH